MFSDSICPTFRKFFVASVFGVCVFLIPNGVQSATGNSATLQWAANQETDLAGYRVYHGTTPGNYGSPQSAGKTTSYQYPNLESNKTHYFSVTAHDTSGNESPPSLEVSKEIIGPEQLAEAAKLAEEQRVAEAAKLAEEQRVAEAAKLQEQQRVAEAVKLAEEQRVAEAAKLQEQQRVAEAAKLQEQQQVAEAAKLAGEQRVAEAARLAEEQRVAEAFALENSKPSLPKPNLPILVNFQPTASQVPTNFKKDDGSVFTSTRGYGWNKLLNGTEQNSTADQTLDTFVGASNQSPGTWNFMIPNGIYYVTMVLGDPKDSQGPHWVSVEGFQLAKQVNTAGGEYLAIVDYSVEVKDSTLSLTLGNSGQGQTILNYLAINEKPNLSNASQTLAQSFGTTLVASVLIPGEATKINPVVLVQKDQEEKDLQEKAMAQGKKQQEEIALALANEKKQKEQEAVALRQAQAKQQAVALKQAQAKQQAVALRQAQAKQRAVVLRQAQAKQQAVALRQAQAKQQKEKEVVKLNKIKEKISSMRKSGGTVSLRNLFGGSR